MAKAESTSKTLDLKEIVEVTQERTCAICCKKFHIHDDLLKHFLQHGNNEIDYLGQPRKRFIRPVTTKDTMIQCEWCPEKFTTISRAIQHKHRKHTNVFTNYYCEYCGKLFPFRISLIQHQFVCQTEQKKELSSSSSSNPGPLYKCVSCDAKFFSLNAKTTHEKNTHFASNSTAIVPPPSKKIRLSSSGWCSLYYCHLCGNEYEIKHNLKKHLETHHTEEERTKFPKEGIIKCKLCDALFHNKNAYNVHNLHHKEGSDIYVHSEEERLRRVTKVDQDIDLNRIPKTIKLTAKGKIPKRYAFMQSVKVNLGSIQKEDSADEAQDQNK
ncbi:zinc finger protein 575-like [Sergentomyia squamirostris]